MWGWFPVQLGVQLCTVHHLGCVIRLRLHSKSHVLRTVGVGGGGHVQHAGSKLVSELHNEVGDFQVFRITLVILRQSLHPQGPFSSCQVST
jgi:hypothetical protein